MDACLMTLTQSELSTRPARRQRSMRLLRVVLDFTVLSACVWLAYLLRFDWRLPPKSAQQALIAWPLIVGLQYALLTAYRVPRFSWSYFSLHEVSRIGASVAVALAVLLLVRYGGNEIMAEESAIRAILVPSGVAVINAVLAMLGLTTVRAMRRMQLERHNLLTHRDLPAERVPAIIIGAGQGGHMLLKELRRRPDLGFHPVAFVDDDPELSGKIIHGVQVLGSTDSLAEIARQRGAKTALLAMATVNRPAMRRIIDICNAAGVPAKMIPPLHDVVSGRVGITQVRDVAIEDLLGREPVQFNDVLTSKTIHGKTVMVTGAGGSIGSELCRQINQLGAGSLILVEQAENAMFHIHREILPEAGNTELIPAIADVTDVARMRQLFKDHRPEIVFHAAAHKHVPMMESNPYEAIKNNFLGTKGVAELAHEFGTADFVLISTDKAVNPTSVMGSTKRLAELAIQDLQKRSETRFVAVRFGNVLGSAGSVIPLFREQIARGGPVLVTHKDMTRYFMTIPEACRLVLEAGGLGEKGSIMVLDMGEPVRIMDMAEQMIRLSGFEPHQDMEIKIVGLRPGEKLYEELALDNERVDSTTVKKVFVWRSQAEPTSPISEIVKRTSSLSNTDPSQVRDFIADVLPEYIRGLESKAKKPARAEQSYTLPNRVADGSQEAPFRGKTGS